MGTVAFSMQDVLLEPYGGKVLHLPVGATTSLTALCWRSAARGPRTGGAEPESRRRSLSGGRLRRGGRAGRLHLGHFRRTHGSRPPLFAIGVGHGRLRRRSVRPRHPDRLHGDGAGRRDRHGARRLGNRSGVWRRAWRSPAAAFSATRCPCWRGRAGSAPPLSVPPPATPPFISSRRSCFSATLVAIGPLAGAREIDTHRARVHQHYSWIGRMTDHTGERHV